MVEGERYRVGNFTFDGNTVVKTDALQHALRIEGGRLLQPEEDPQGVPEGAGGLRAGGYYEFTGYPEPVARDEPAAGGG